MDTLKKFRLDGKVVVITGGAGLLGRQYAVAVAEAGGIPIIADINSAEAEEIAGQLKKSGAQALAVSVDVTDKGSIENMVKVVLKKFGRIDGLVNNAAIDPKFDKQSSGKNNANFEEFSIEDWNKSIDVNITGMFLCCQAISKVMLEAGGGSIVNISSTYGLAGPDQRIYNSGYKPVSYSVTKSAVLGLTRYLAAYFAGKGVRVNTLTPGGVYNYHEPEFVKRYSSRTILGRMAMKDEYNGALLFLLSGASSYMTGSNLIIDGGWTAW